MVQKSFLILVSCFLLNLSGIGLRSAIAQADQAEIFDEFCADCHSIGDGDMRGPDLLGMEQRRSQKWLIDFIRSAKTMISSGDPASVKVWEKYNKKSMPDTDLSDAEIKAMIAYIKSFNKTIEVKKPVTPTGNVSMASNGNKQAIDNLTSQITEYEEKLQNIEKKLDLILEFHKKSLSARITNEEINKGRELFEGDVAFVNNVPVCATCHNTYEIDTLNWNPSAFEIATAFSKRNNVDMGDIIVNPQSDKMKEVLKDHKLTDNETFYITAFLQSMEKTGLEENVKIPTKSIIFIVLCFLMVLSAFDLIFTKFIKKKWINIAVFFVTLIFVSNSIWVSASNVGLSQNYAPDQPIKFSHKIHVKENKIECIFCHNSPEYSRESGIPTTNVCMICHNKIKTGKLSGEFEISKIKNSFKNMKPIEWIKVHNLPDHVFFSHAQHVSVAKIDCQTCHGAVEEMHITSQYSSLSMGWCVECHRENEIQFEENKYYSNHKELHADLNSGKIDRVTADQIGANDCQKCHY